MSQFWSPDEVRRSPDDHQNKKRILTNLEVIMYTETLYGPTVGHGLSKVSIFLIFHIFLSSTLHLILFWGTFLRSGRGPDKVRTKSGRLKTQNAWRKAWYIFIYFRKRVPDRNWTFRQTSWWSMAPISSFWTSRPDFVRTSPDLVRTSSGPYCNVFNTIYKVRIGGHN